MPAVELTQLKKEINDLLWKYTLPLEFEAGLEELLGNHADRTLRPSKAAPPSELIGSYRVPVVLMRQLELALVPSCRENPDAGLTLADHLWKHSHLEPRQLAAFLLGQYPLKPVEAVVNRISTWCQPNENRMVVQAVIEKGGRRLRAEAPDQWLALAQSWSESTQPVQQTIGIEALILMLKEPGFENLPVIFRLASPLVTSGSPALFRKLEPLLTALAHRSPTETAYFLRQILNVSAQQETIRFVRRLLPAFPAEKAEELRASLRSRSARS